MSAGTDSAEPGPLRYALGLYYAALLRARADPGRFWVSVTLRASVKEIHFRIHAAGTEDEWERRRAECAFEWRLGGWVRVAKAGM